MSKVRIASVRTVLQYVVDASKKKYRFQAVGTEVKKWFGYEYSA